MEFIMSKYFIDAALLMTVTVISEIFGNGGVNIGKSAFNKNKIRRTIRRIIYKK